MTSPPPESGLPEFGSPQPESDGHLRYLLTAYLFENLTAEGVTEVEAHLEGCPECREELKRLRATLRLVEDALAPADPGSMAAPGEYHFDQLRLERVLAASSSRPLLTRLATPGAAAAVLLIGIGFMTLLLLPSRMSGRRGASEWSARVTAPSSERAVTRSTEDAEDGFFGWGAEDPGQPTGEAFPAPSDAMNSRNFAHLGEPVEEVEIEGTLAVAPLQTFGRGGESYGYDDAVAGTTLSFTPPDASAGLPSGGGGGGLPPTQPPAVFHSNAAPHADPAEAGEVALYAQPPVGAARNPERAEFEKSELQGDRAGAAKTETKKLDFGTRRGRGSFSHAGAGVAAAPAPPRNEGPGLARLDEKRVVAERDARQRAAPNRDAREPDAEEDFRAAGDLTRGEAWYKSENKNLQGGRAIELLDRSLEEEQEASPPLPRSASIEFSREALRESRRRVDLDDAPALGRFASPETTTAASGESRDKGGAPSFGEPMRGLAPPPARKMNLKPMAPQEKAVREAESRAASPDERTLRAFQHYRNLDPELDLGRFLAEPLTIPAPRIGDEGLGRDGFRRRYGVNPFVETSRDALSTFAMDVDTASYTRAVSRLADGRLPDPGTVRTEEFVNAFPDPRPAASGRAFSVFVEGGPSPFGGIAGEGGAAIPVEQLQITVKARELAAFERRPLNLTLALDTSGSMGIEARLGAVREAVSTLLQNLDAADRVGVVAYGSQAYLVLPHTAATERERILEAIDGLTGLGSTNVEAGLDLAYRIADEVAHPRAVNRVILCSDGVATSGARSADEILGSVRVYADRGIYLSVIGFGRGRYDDRFLEQLADRGNGNYAYVDSPADARRTFEENLPAALSVLARDAKIQVEFDPAVVSRYRLLGYENRDIADRDFRNDAIDAGEVGPGSTVTAIYEIVRRPASSGALGRVFLRYHDTTIGRVDELDFPIPPGVMGTSLDRTSPRFRLLAATAELAELLRGSYFARDGAFGPVLHLLEQLPPVAQRRDEVRTLIETTRRALELSRQRWSQ